MEHAKKLVLVDPRLIDEMMIKKAEYKELEKPSDKKTKTELSLKMQDVLRQENVGDDVLAKQYQQMFRKFMSTHDTLPAEQKVAINELSDRKKVRVERKHRSVKKKLKWSPY